LLGNICFLSEIIDPFVNFCRTAMYGKPGTVRIRQQEQDHLCGTAGTGQLQGASETGQLRQDRTLKHDSKEDSRERRARNSNAGTGQPE
jgi:hypothetical protein